METSAQISKETAKRLMYLKLDTDAKNIDAVIKMLLDNYDQKNLS